jgi:Fe-S cluster biogenesis protein NfuA
MSAEADTRAVVSHFQAMLAGDGALVQLLALDGGLMKVGHVPGDCEGCLLAPEDLSGMMEELLVRRSSSLKKVEVV